jgi:hypothetical protein
MDTPTLDQFKSPVPRKLMSRDEIQWAERMVKLGLMTKGRSTERNGGVIYYATNKTGENT